MLFNPLSAAVTAAFAAATVQGAVTSGGSGGGGSSGGGGGGGGGGMQSPPFPADAFFNRPAGVPPVAQVKFTFTNPFSGNPIDYYQLEMRAFTSPQYPNLPETPQVGYNGSTPGPTFIIQQGREAIVRHVNHNVRNTSVHLHGSFSRSSFDGYADDVTQPNWYKDYYYPNLQNARTLWYHDHAVDNTAENVYFGLAGFHILHDPEELALDIPHGQFDMPLGIMARRYQTDGTLWDPEANNEVTSVYGDVVEVNGVPWPFLEVEPRKYRFRFLDMGISRTYILFLTADQQGGAGLNFTMIGSDAGLLAHPVETSTLTISIAERWEAIIDFAGFEGQNITLNNQRGVGADQDFENTDKVLRFVVGTTVSSQQGNGPVPAVLRDIDFAEPQQTITARHFLFHHDQNWMINNVGWNDGFPARLMARPQRGSTEQWTLQNGGGGWSHPIHIHLIDFQVIRRTGDREVLPYESVAQQDVVWLGPGETVTVIARWQPWTGRYMIHCHNLIHEDHDMLAEWNVTEPEGFVTNETNFFIDPLEQRFQEVGPINEVDFAAGTGNFSEEAVRERAMFFASTKAYLNVNEIEAELEAFWAAKEAKEKRDGKYEHYDMPARERRARLQGWYAPEMTGYGPKQKKRAFKRSPQLPGPHGFAHLSMVV